MSGVCCVASVCAETCLLSDLAGGLSRLFVGVGTEWTTHTYPPSANSTIIWPTPAETLAGCAVAYVAPMRAALAPSNSWHMLVWDYIRHAHASEDTREIVWIDQTGAEAAESAHAETCRAACGFVCGTPACVPNMLFQHIVLQYAILYHHAQTKCLGIHTRSLQ